MQTLSIGALAVGSMGLSACGEDSSEADAGPAEAPSSAATTGGSAATTPPPAPAPVRATTIRMGAPAEFSMTPAPATVSAGTATFTIVNDGTIEHEVVVMRTDKDSGALPTTATGAAVETGVVAPLAKKGAEPGHHGTHVHVGKRTKTTIRLPQGRYALVCNLPGHYAAGMHANLVVN